MRRSLNGVVLLMYSACTHHKEARVFSIFALSISSEVRTNTDYIFYFIYTIHTISPCIIKHFYSLSTGVPRFCKDLEVMLGTPQNIYFKICWYAISPLAVLVSSNYRCLSCGPLNMT